jgi:AcrR family transcriptional regulator
LNRAFISSVTAIPALRPPVSDSGAATRERILDAAETLFAAQGHGASVRQITAEAGCNLAAVSYHFGGKERLYEEVFRRRLEPLREQRLRGIAAFIETAGAGLTLEDLLRAYAAAFLESWVESRRGSDFMRLLSRETVEPHLPPGFLAAFFEPIHEAFSAALARLVPGLEASDARLASHSFVALLSNALSIGRAYGSRSGPASLALPSLVDHTSRLLAGGIRALVKTGKRGGGRAR